MRKILIVILMVFVVSCAKKYVKTPEEPVKAEETAKESLVEKEVIKENILPTEEGVKGSLVATEIEDEAEAIFEDVLFDFDKYNIMPDARPVLDSVASWLNKNKEANIIIEGHCDERGTNEYNLALGEKRAKATRDYLVSLGVSPVRISLITYGEEKPVCIEQNEGCWQQNRRAHFVIAE